MFDDIKKNYGVQKSIFTMSSLFRIKNVLKFINQIYVKTIFFLASLFYLWAVFSNISSCKRTKNGSGRQLFPTRSHPRPSKMFYGEELRTKIAKESLNKLCKFKILHFVTNLFVVFGLSIFDLQVGHRDWQFFHYLLLKDISSKVKVNHFSRNYLTTNRVKIR